MVRNKAQKSISDISIMCFEGFAVWIRLGGENKWLPRNRWWVRLNIIHTYLIASRFKASCTRGSILWNLVSVQLKKYIPVWKKKRIYDYSCGTHFWLVKIGKTRLNQDIWHFCFQNRFGDKQIYMEGSPAAPLGIPRGDDAECSSCDVYGSGKHIFCSPYNL